MARIDYFFSTLSPFTYLAGTRLEEIAARHGAEVVYKPFGIAKIFEVVGTPAVPNRHDSKKVYRTQELMRISKRAGLRITLQPMYWPTNPVPSMSAIIAAQSAGGGDVGGLTHGLMRACWAEEKDIAEDAVIIECLEANGFDGKLVNAGMLSGSETIERNTQEAVDRGVFGSPTYLVGEEVFWGQDRLDYLDAYLGEQG